MKSKKLKYGGRAIFLQSTKKLFDGKHLQFRPTAEVSALGKRATSNGVKYKHITAEYIKSEGYGYIEVTAEELDKAPSLFEVYKACSILKHTKKLEVEFLIIGADVYSLDRYFINKENTNFKVFENKTRKDTSVYNYKGKGAKFGLQKAKNMTSKLIENL